MKIQTWSLLSIFEPLKMKNNRTAAKTSSKAVMKAIIMVLCLSSVVLAKMP